jgi:transposase
MAIGVPKDLTDCRRFFSQPATPRHRLYEALRAFFVEARPSGEVARTFGYSPGTFRVLCHTFRRDPAPSFFVTPRRGPQSQPKKSAARQMAIALRKQNHSVYEISEALKEKGLALSPTAVREVLKEEGFAPLPRRSDEDRPVRPHPTIEVVANVGSFSLAPRAFSTTCGGLFLLLPDMVGVDVSGLAAAVRLPGSTMIPADHALRACLALKLWSLERKSHVMALAADEGLALFSGLNATPKKSYLSEYSSRVTHTMTEQLLACWQARTAKSALFPGHSFNLDFHSVPYYGEHPVVERHYVSARSRRQPSILAFLAQDADSRSFCYSNADLRKGEEADEILRFIEFWKSICGKLPSELVFDSRLTTYENLARVDAMGIPFMTLRRRSPALLAQIATLPRSAWRLVELDVPTRRFRSPKVFEQKVHLAGATFRQLFIKDLGHDESTILLTNKHTTSLKKIITRYAQRMLIENALSDAVRFFHMDALSSAVGLKVDFDMALLVVASGLYRLLGRRMRGYADAQARNIFRDIVNIPADVEVRSDEVLVRFHRRAHLPIVAASGLLDSPVAVPWWNGRRLRLLAR